MNTKLQATETIDQFLKLGQPVPLSESRSSMPAETILAEVVDAVKQKVSPTVGIEEWVAVNPLAGWTGDAFVNVAQHLQQFHGTQIVPDFGYFAKQLEAGALDWDDVQRSILECQEDFWIVPDLEQVRQRMQSAIQDDPSMSDSRPLLRLFSEMGEVWSDVLGQEVGDLCGSYFDRGQAAWQRPGRDESLFSSWRRLAQLDCGLELAGLNQFRQLVAQLPQDSQSALIHLLDQIGVPVAVWELWLEKVAWANLGWSAYARHRDERNQELGTPSSHFQDLLAIRLAMEVGVAEAMRCHIDWSGLVPDNLTSTEATVDPDLMGRKVLQRAMEIRFREQTLKQMQEPAAAEAQESSIQFLFCIDVRSEALRRQLEAQGMETRGVAGFFNVPMAFEDEQQLHRQLPVLLSPQWKVLGKTVTQVERLWERVGQQLALSLKPLKRMTHQPIGGFTFVESLGTWHLGLFLQRSLHKFFGQSRSRSRSLESCGSLSLAQMADCCEALLRNAALVDAQAETVVICGHESCSANNPLHASLECGACGGHSGEINARLICDYLNRPEVRNELKRRGLVIAEATRFVPAVHLTQTPGIQLLEEELLGNRPQQLQHLKEVIAQAAQAAGQELGSKEGQTPVAWQRRGRNWAEIRPEWGLAGNAAFVIGPRSWSEKVDLGGRVFLHEYDQWQDADGSHLHGILNAPGVVAQWINAQYNFSSAAPQRFGSGRKTVHNVVGRLGVLSGAGGDLQLGFPEESVHDGTHLRHSPLRLQMVIVAERSRIEKQLMESPEPLRLVKGQWIHLYAIENGRWYRRSSRGGWLACETCSSQEVVV